jgi:putative SOS response-associated peptidase YedK
MCGRFTLSIDAQALADHFGLAASRMPPLEPRYNIAPTQPILVVRADPERQAELMRWGLIPLWAKDPSIGNKMINARSETVEDKPAFRSAFKRRRCLVPADGFYEWRAEDGRKQPYHIHPVAGGPIGIAGLWERWQAPSGEEIHSCTLLTRGANAVMEPLHDRMPLILRPEDYAAWLDPAARPEEVRALVAENTAPALAYHPVSTMVNAPGRDDPAMVAMATG